MRIVYKSVPIVQAYRVDRIVTTTFDMKDVRDHELLVSIWRLVFYPRYFFRGMLLWGALALGLSMAKGYRIENPVVLGCVLTGLFAAVCWGVYALAYGKFMEDHARTDRNVASDFPLRVVEERDWPLFVQQLRELPG